LALSADPAFGEGRRAGAMFFARHRDYFVVTRNFTAVYRDLVPSSNFIVTQGYLPTYRDFAKTHANPDMDGNSPTTGPLAFMSLAT
jgi:hypothetical protein